MLKTVLIFLPKSLEDKRDGESSNMSSFTIPGAVIALAAVLVLVVLLAVFIRRRRYGIVLYIKLVNVLAHFNIRNI